MVGMVCGKSSSSVSLFKEVTSGCVQLQLKARVFVQYATALPKSMVMLCFIRKSQPKLTGHQV